MQNNAQPLKSILKFHTPQKAISCLGGDSRTHILAPGRQAQTLVAPTAMWLASQKSNTQNWPLCSAPAHTDTHTLGPSLACRLSHPSFLSLSLALPPSFSSYTPSLLPAASIAVQHSFLDPFSLRPLLVVDITLVLSLTNSFAYITTIDRACLDILHY